MRNEIFLKSSPLQQEMLHETSTFWRSYPRFLSLATKTFLFNPGNLEPEKHKIPR
jgi:hypothetical protein